MTDIYIELMITHQNNGQIISSFQKPPLNQYFFEKPIYPPDKNSRYQSCIKLPKIINETDLIWMPTMYEGKVPGNLHDPTCEQNLDSPELLKDALMHLKSSLAQDKKVESP